MQRLAELDPESEAAQCLDEDILNHHFRRAMAGESTKKTDFRKVVKVKPPKEKDPLKGKIPGELAKKKSASERKKKSKQNKENQGENSRGNKLPYGAQPKFGVRDIVKDVLKAQDAGVTPKGKCFSLRRGYPKVLHGRFLV